MIGAQDILNAKILIVDDEAANVLLLERLLRGAGYTSVASTTNPNAVRDLHQEHRYDLILLDLQMPGTNGFQVMDGLKHIDVDGYLPVLVLTAEPTHKLRALEAGAKDFLSKPFDLAEVLARVHNMLEVRLLHLKTKYLYDRVLEEQRVSERLLRNVLPSAIAERLKGRPVLSDHGFTEFIVDSFSGVTVLFADIVDFTKFSRTVSPEVLVELLNDLFTRFDNIANYRGVEKIKTIGDSYMAAAGLPLPVDDHPLRAAHMALDMIDALKSFNAETGHMLTMRIGIASGAVVAGVIGKQKFVYDLWGDVVNTASRMESHGLAGRIQVTDSTRLQLNKPFTFEERGAINVKGSGEMHTWFLNSRQSDELTPPLALGRATAATALE
jgi:adenylate cyclase